MNQIKIKLALAKMLPEMIDVNQNCVDGYRFSWKDGKHQLITSREWLYVVHECEKKLDTIGLKTTYLSYLEMVVLGHQERAKQYRIEMFNTSAAFALITATFDQRAEALLRTLGLWGEE